MSFFQSIKKLLLILCGVIMVIALWSAPSIAAEPGNDPDLSSILEAQTSPPTPDVADKSALASLGEHFQFDLAKEDVRKRPLLYFRTWANKPLPAVQSFLFLLFVTILASELMPARLDRARRACASSYWRSVWYGIVACLMFVAAARALFLTEIGMPLALVCLAALELLLLIGFSVSSTLIGQTLMTTMRVNRLTGRGSAWIGRFGAPILGTLVLSIVLMIPQIGMLPRIGIRLIMLLCFLGMGALFRTRMGTKEMGGKSEQ